jgi:hypothetical protein
MRKALMVIVCIGLYCAQVQHLYAQEGYHVLVDFVPEQIEILPNVYEMYGTIIAGPDSGKACYALSVNSVLVGEVRDSLIHHTSQILNGPKLEKLVQEKIIEDYRVVRFQLEKDLRKEIEDADSTEKKSLQKELKLEQQNTKQYLKRLKLITERYTVRAIYVYGRKSVAQSSYQDKTFKKVEENTKKTTPVKSKSKNDLVPEADRWLENK